MSELITRQSGIWQTNSTILAADGLCLVVDPAYFPRELDELAALASARGGAAAVVFTHGHWDHVGGWQSFPGAAVWASPSLAAAFAGDTDEARKNLDALRDFDGRWYVDRPWPHAWPPTVRGLADGEEVALGPIAARALCLPGHSPDGLALHVPEHRLLLPGDYLSPCEIPFVADLAAYRATLRRLATLLADIDIVIPGHGPRLDRATAARILEEDLDYLDPLAALAGAGDVAGALALPLPRAAAVPGMRDHHRDNCAAAGLRVEAGDIQ